MKKLISITLAAIMVVAALAGCASEKNTIDPQIRMTSSDAADAAEWLDQRLGTIPDRIVIGTQTDGYGIDVSALENDGYIIRNLAGEIALFAKTADGLDRAVRKYAKSVEAGIGVEDVTYHEGTRIKKITVAGRDISEYTIFCDDDERLRTAAGTFSDRIAEACGAVLPISTDSPRAPYILVRFVRDGELKNVGYRWNVTEDGITFDCSDVYKNNSANVALTRFLVNRLDWFGLDFGFEDLPSADLIEIKSGENGTETPCFDWARPTSGQWGEYLPHYGLDLGPRIAADSGIQLNQFGGELSTSRWGTWTEDQPCWLDEDFYDIARADIVKYIEDRLASGQVIGEDFTYIDIAQGDNRNWCKCTKCMKQMVVDRSQSGSVITWANKISEDLNETYPGLYYYVFAYNETRVPPKVTKPNELIYITYSYNHPCSSHTLDGTHCTTFDNWPNDKGLATRNDVMAEQVRTWAKMTPKLTVWTYGSCDGLMSMNYVHTVRDDIRFLYYSGVAGHYGEGEDNSFDPNWIARWLEYSLYWDIDMPDEKYDALYSRIVRILYGDGYDLVREYVDLHGQAFENGKCETCYHAYAIGRIQDEPINKEFISANYDLMFDLMERAISLADSADTERRSIKLQCSCIFQGSIASFESASNAGDDARVSVIKERYALIAARLSAYGIDFYKGAFPDMNPHDYFENLEDYFN